MLAALLAGCGAAAHTSPISTPTEFREPCVRTEDYPESPISVQAATDPPRLVHDLLCRDDFAPGQIVDVRVVRALVPLRITRHSAHGHFVMRYTATAPDGTLLERGYLDVPIDHDGTIGHYSAAR